MSYVYTWNFGNMSFSGTLDEYDTWFTSIGEKQLANDKTLPDTELVAPKCECGSESAGSSRHALYCPKFEK